MSRDIVRHSRTAEVGDLSIEIEILEVGDGPRRFVVGDTYANGTLTSRSKDGSYATIDDAVKDVISTF